LPFGSAWADRGDDIAIGRIAPRQPVCPGADHGADNDHADG
jgi:hypothetical protein